MQDAELHAEEQHQAALEELQRSLSEEQKTAAAAFEILIEGLEGTRRGPRTSRFAEIDWRRPNELRGERGYRGTLKAQGPQPAPHQEYDRPARPPPSSLQLHQVSNTAES